MEPFQNVNIDRIKLRDPVLSENGDLLMFAKPLLIKIGTLENMKMLLTKHPLYTNETTVGFKASFDVVQFLNLVDFWLKTCIGECDWGFDKPTIIYSNCVHKNIAYFTMKNQPEWIFDQDTSYNQWVSLVLVFKGVRLQKCYGKYNTRKARAIYHVKSITNKAVSNRPVLLYAQHVA